MGHGTSRTLQAGNILASDEQIIVENLFRSMSRSSGSIKREDVFKHWSMHLAKFLCHDPVKKSSTVNGENFGRLYVYSVRGAPDERTSLVFNGYSDGEEIFEMPMSSFIRYVEATLSSYLRLQKNSNNPNYTSWTTIGCMVNCRRTRQYSESMCEEIAKYGEVLTCDQLEIWFSKATTFKLIQSHVFQILFLLSQKKGDKNNILKLNEINLLPICRGLDNIPQFPSILGVGDILFLNLTLPHELRNEWRFLFSTEIHGESFSTMLGRISMQGATLLIIQDADNHVFGAFASDSWSLSPNFVGNDSCYLFVLEPKILTFPATGYNNHYQYLNLHQQTMPNGLLMGGQLNYPGLWLDCEYGTGKSSPSCTTFQNYIQLSGSENFTIKHCEVWGVGPAPAVDEEERGASVLDQDPTAQIMLELAGRTMHSDGLRDKKKNKK